MRLEARAQYFSTRAAVSSASYLRMHRLACFTHIITGTGTSRSYICIYAPCIYYYYTAYVILYFLLKPERGLDKGFPHESPFRRRRIRRRYQQPGIRSFLGSPLDTAHRIGHIHNHPQA